MVRFHETLSERSVYLRYFHAMKLSQRVAHERLTRICFIDYDREMALVAERANPETGEPEILAVGRLSKHAAGRGRVRPPRERPFPGPGPRHRAAGGLLEVGRDEGLRRITAEILPENPAMQRLSRKARLPPPPRSGRRRRKSGPGPQGRSTGRVREGDRNGRYQPKASVARNKKTGARQTNRPSATPKKKDPLLLLLDASALDGRRVVQAITLTPSANGPRNLKERTSEMPKTSQDVKRFISGNLSYACPASSPPG